MKQVLIPTEILKDTKFSVLESLVKFLKEEKQLTYVQIADLLNRDQRNIWTIYQRVQKKGAKNV